MSARSVDAWDGMWARHHAQWRDPAQIVSQWREAADTDPLLLQHKARGKWWEILATAGITLLVTREYEHLVMAMQTTDGGPYVTYMRMPHPSGLAVDRPRGIVHIASTRNPNQVHDLKPVKAVVARQDADVKPPVGHPLVPATSRFFPGCLYMHDLAVMDGALYASAVGQNAIVRLFENGQYERVWWPRCIETDNGPLFGQNYVQLNSIAGASSLQSSYFSASAERLSARRPGHLNFPVDRRGVIFFGRTREPVVRRLTRPHSARLHYGRLWVANSGYGEVGVCEIAEGTFCPVVRLPGWTRGLCFHRGIAFVGTSRVIPRFRQYAPGLDVDASVCGVHAVDIARGEVLGSLIWPYGNQIFAVDWVPRVFTNGFPFTINGRGGSGVKTLFYAFDPNHP